MAGGERRGRGLYGLRILPQILIYKSLPESNRLHADLKRWIEVIDGEREPDARRRFQKFVQYFATLEEFRSLFYYRAPRARRFAFLARPCASLFLHTEDIGGGLFLQHSFSTIVLARSIGENCWINQQVTIGFSRADAYPTIGDNVTVGAGAKILGDVRIGDRVTIGANAVVVKSVDPGCTVVGAATRVVRRDGRKVDETL